MTKNSIRLVHSATASHPTLCYIVLAFFSSYNNSTSDIELASHFSFLS